MLKFLRTHRTGFFGLFVLGLVCLTMVGFGINFFAPQGANEAVIKVNQREITFNTFQNKLNQYRGMLQQRFGENFDQLASFVNFEQETVDQLVDEALLEEFIDEADIVPSTALVYQRIAALPYFNGVVTESSYRAFLNASGMSGPQLEASMRQELAVDIIRQAFSDLSAPTEAELRQAYEQANKEMAFHLARFSPSAFEAEVNLDNEEALRTFFEENQESYRRPEKVQYQAAAFRSSAYLDEVSVTEEDLEYTYERIRSTFSEAPKVQFRRITFKKRKDESNPLEELVAGEDQSTDPAMSTPSFNAQQKAKAEEVRERIEAADSFAEVAKEVSEDEVTKASGGLIEFTEYSLLNEPFRSALHDLEEGELSAVLEDDDGYYLLEVDKKTERVAKPLEEVKDQVKRRIQSEYAPEYARAAAEEFLASLPASANTEQFQALTKEQGVPLAETLQPVQAGQASGAIPVEVTDTALTLSEGDVEIVEAGGDTYVVQVKGKVESSIPEFTDVAAQVREDYRMQRAKQLAKTAAEEFLASLKERDNIPSQFPEAAAATKASVEKTELAKASSPTDPVLRQPMIAQQAYSLSESNPVLRDLQESGGDFVVIAFADKKIPADESFRGELNALEVQEKRRSAERLFATLSDVLHAEAEVWVDPSLLENSLDSAPAAVL